MHLDARPDAPLLVDDFKRATAEHWRDALRDGGMARYGGTSLWAG